MRLFFRDETVKGYEFGKSLCGVRHKIYRPYKIIVDLDEIYDSINSDMFASNLFEYIMHVYNSMDLDNEGIILRGTEK